MSLFEAKFHELGGNEYKRATVQGPVGKVELQGGQMLHCSRRLTVSVGIVLLALVAAAPLGFGQSTPVTYQTDVQVSNQVTSRLEKVAGISQLSIDPVLGGDQQNPGARIAIQQRVTSKIFVTFATDVTSTQRQVIKLEYQVSPRLSVNAVRDQNGGFAFDTRIHKTW